ncbi:MAG TPA: hypothetical protein VFA39_06510 [Steroidobacteraceae bacterium]|nr:hypothetical protein [Steroidobacteraceae bacterium]
MTNEHEHKHHHDVEARVITTAGSYPTEGYEKEPATQPVQEILKRAARELHLVDTSSWVARCNGVDLQPQRSYAENGLKGRVDIDYGPPERGGGSSHA